MTREESRHEEALLPPEMHSLLDSPSPAVLTTYRRDGSALATPVWFRHDRGVFEVVIAEDDVKVQHLRRDPRCSLLVFEAVPPFRGVEARGTAELVECDVTPIRAEIAGRFLGPEFGARFAAERSKPGLLLRLSGPQRTWDLSGILPAGLAEADGEPAAAEKDTRGAASPRVDG